MIYRLRRKFIGICVLSFLAVLLLVIALLFLVTTLQTNRQLDLYADIISQNDGRFPNFEDVSPHGNLPPMPDDFNRESPFTTRFFTVRYDEAGEVLAADIASVASVDEAEAIRYGEEVIEKAAERGWVGNYRYKLYEGENGQAAVFISGVSARASNRSFLVGTLSVFAVCSVVIILLIILISGRAVKPAAESYEKQKQFITNANHELKTPLTLIRTNLDILEAEQGASEWITDIRDETLLMNDLVCRMVTLARMDEDGTRLDLKPFDLSEAALETVSVFSPTIERGHRHLSLSVKPRVTVSGDEAALRQVISILMDNAVKYCDEGGEITVALTGDRHPTLTVENTYAAASTFDLDRLFDRFYRADKACTYGTGFGIGLSMAKAIVEKHKGSISAYRPGEGRIGFRVKL